MRGDRGLLGAGSQADETEQFDTAHRFVFRAVDRIAENSTDARLIEIESATQEQLSTPVTAAVGAPGLRRELVARWKGTLYHSVIAETAWVSPSATIGAGSTIAPGAVITADTRLGEHVIVNIGATISHTCVIGDFVTISPGAHIAGDCSIGAGTFIGVGAVVSHGVSIASGCVIGAGTVVTRDLDHAGVWVGSPARLIRKLDAWITQL